MKILGGGNLVEETGQSHRIVGGRVVELKSLREAVDALTGYGNLLEVSG